MPVNRRSIMIVAGEPSGDVLAAELVRALRRKSADFGQPFEPEFFGAGGSHMARAGVDLEFDLTRHAVVGLLEVFRKIRQFWYLIRRLDELAARRQPDIVVHVDFSAFNHRLAHAIRASARKATGPFTHWDPLIVKYVSPQVWASRPGRADAMAKDFDLLLCLFPFEKEWYAKRVPSFAVEFAGHPIVDRYQLGTATGPIPQGDRPWLALLPGSRERELASHLPPMLGALAELAAQGTFPCREARLVLPSDRLLSLALGHLRSAAQKHQCRLDEAEGRAVFSPGTTGSIAVRWQIGGLHEVLRSSCLAIACSGTVTLECAWFRVPTVVIYRTSFTTYWVARQVVTVKYLAMPNLLAGEPVFPELIQDQVTSSQIARAALELGADPQLRSRIASVLDRLAASLGEPGSANRAACAIWKRAAAKRR
jgi:lipid-A-disaccharide synthase